MKTYIHARLTRADRQALESLKAATGQSESALVRRGLALVAAEMQAQPSALDLAGRSAGRFTGGADDLSANRAHLDGFGE